MVLKLFGAEKRLGFGLISEPNLAPFWLHFGSFGGPHLGQPEPSIWQSLWAGLAGPRAEASKFPPDIY